MNHIDPQALLAHHGWVRALARTLARDAAGADDLEQEVWSRALSDRARRGSDLKAWLGSIVRNTAREDWRDESRARDVRQRVGREIKSGQEFGSHRRAEETPAERQVRMETHRALLSALTELEEPYGSVVYLRFVDELSVQEIAVKLGSPEPTVRTHLRRGLERLRERVEGSLGEDWRARVMVLALPVSKASVGLLASGGIALMSLKLAVAACAAVVVLAYSLGAFDGPAEATHVASQPSTELVDLTGSLEAGGPTLAPVPNERVPSAAQPEHVQVQESEVAAPPVTEPGLRVIVGDHLRFDPIPGAEVLAIYSESPLWEEFTRAMFDEHVDMETLLDRFGERYGVDAKGVAMLPTRTTFAHLAARAEGVFTHEYLTQPRVPGEIESIALFPLPKLHLKVRVLDAGGRPAADQRVEFQQTFSNSLGQSLASAHTDAEGLAEFRNFQGKLHNTDERTTYCIAVPIPGLGAVSVDLNPNSPPTKEVVLRLPALGHAVVYVQDEFGVPARDGTRVTVQATAPSHGELLEYGTNSALGGVQLTTLNGRAETPVQLGQSLMASTFGPVSGTIAIERFDAPAKVGGLVEVVLKTKQAPKDAQVRLLDSAGLPVQSQSLDVTHVRLAGDLAGNQQALRAGTGPSGILKATAPDVVDANQRSLGGETGATFASEQASGLLRFGWIEWKVGGKADLVLGKELIVAGSVVDETGQALAGSHISLDFALPWSGEQMEMTYLHVETNSEGHFEIWGLLPDDPERYSLSSNQPLGGRSVQPHALAFTPGQDDLVISLRRLPAISGRVLVDAGIASVLSLRIESVDDSSLGFRWIDLDSLGRFDFRLDYEGSVFLKLLASGGLEVARSPEIALSTGVEVTPVGWEELDLRRKLVLHEIEVRAESGSLPTQISIHMTEHGKRFSATRNAQLVTDTEWVTISIDAEGFESSTPQRVSGATVITLLPKL